MSRDGAADEWVFVRKDDVQGIIDWWRGPNEAPGGCSPRAAIDGMKDHVWNLKERLELGPAGIVTEGLAMDAILQLAWHVGPVNVSIRGTHLNYESVTCGGHSIEGQWSEVAPKLTAWSEAVRNREANAAIPAPPE